VLCHVLGRQAQTQVHYVVDEDKSRGFIRVGGTPPADALLVEKEDSARGGAVPAVLHY
jgi:hypothetical protein